jgi:hypothetical protein
MKDKSRVDVGMHVEVDLLERSGASQHLVFDIVQDRAADFASGLLGESTPLARTLRGHKAGDVIPYPQEDIYAVRILEVSTSAEETGEEAAERRKEAALKAVRDAERDSAITFASSFSGKWGDYDPDSLMKDENEEKI